MKKLKLSNTVQYLDIVCYAEQLLFFDGENEDKAWEDIKEKKIKCIRKDDLVVFCIAQQEDDGKIHYHFAVFVSKRKGEARKQRVSYVLNALGIRFREEDRELFETTKFKSLELSTLIKNSKINFLLFFLFLLIFSTTF